MPEMLPAIGGKSERDNNARLVELYNCLRNIRGDGLIGVHRNQSGLTLSFNINEARARIVTPRTLNVAFLQIFEVQDSTEADGVYQCYKQSTFGVFMPPAIDVLNLLENDTIDDYENALAKEDRIAAWQMTDEDETSRWVGTPLTPSMRLAVVTESPPAGLVIVCNLIANDGVTEITSGLGSGIHVNCKISNGNALSVATPRLAIDDYILVQNISGQWHCAGFQGTENCECEIPT